MLERNCILIRNENKINDEGFEAFSEYKATINAFGLAKICIGLNFIYI